MKHRTTKQFWKLYEGLPNHIQKLAEKNFELLKLDREHPSLKFKKIANMWSVRAGAHYRALGFDYHDYVLWFWIGSHAEYDKLAP